MIRWLSSILFALTALSVFPDAASAQLEDAEAAYVDVDFERTLAASQAAIDSGELNPSELARAYELLGVSAVALGDANAARDCFLRMLSIDADHALDDTVPPRFRAPFLEARGIVSARPDQMASEVTLVRAEGALRVGLVDPYEMVQGVRLHMRTEGSVEYETFEAPFAEEILAPFAAASGDTAVEYWLELIDPRGNELMVQGSQFAPLVLGRTVVAGGPEGTTSGGTSIFEEPAFWVVVLSVVAVGAGVGIAVGVDQSSRVSLQTTITF